MATHIPSSLQTLFRTQQLWCANSHTPSDNAINTGYPSLNSALHNGGWPQTGVVELLCEQAGIGELQLLLPAMLYSQQQQRHILLSNTPYSLYMPALSKAGINSQALLLLKPLAKASLLWALEKSLRSGACGNVVSWCQNIALRSSELRKLQLAAKHGNSLLFLYRHPRHAQQASPAKLRIQLQKPGQQLSLRIIKQPGGWAGQTIRLAQTQHAHRYVKGHQLPSFCSQQISTNPLANSTDQAPTVPLTIALNA